MHIVSQLNTDSDDIEAHLNHMFARRAVVPSSDVALERILQANMNGFAVHQNSQHTKQSIQPKR